MRIGTVLQLLDEAAADMQKAVTKTQQAYSYLQKYPVLNDDEEDNLIESFFGAKEQNDELTRLLTSIKSWAFEGE